MLSFLRRPCVIIRPRRVSHIWSRRPREWLHYTKSCMVWSGILPSNFQLRTRWNRPSVPDESPSCRTPRIISLLRATWFYGCIMHLIVEKETILDAARHDVDDKKFRTVLPIRRTPSTDMIPRKWFAVRTVYSFFTNCYRDHPPVNFDLSLSKHENKQKQESPILARFMREGSNLRENTRKALVSRMVGLFSGLHDVISRVMIQRMVEWWKNPR